MSDTTTAAATPGTTPPSLLRHLAAMVYDTLLVLPVIMLCVALFLGVSALLGLGAGEDGTVQLDANVVRLIGLLTVWGFFSGFWLKGGQTLGMQAWRIQLVSSDGKPLKFTQTITRTLGAVLSFTCLGLGYLWCLIDRNRYYWHDHLSGTHLILLPKRDKKKAH